jgi:hypothetical protein
VEVFFQEQTSYFGSQNQRRVDEDRVGYSIYSNHTLRAQSGNFVDSDTFKVARSGTWQTYVPGHLTDMTGTEALTRHLSGPVNFRGCSQKHNGAESVVWNCSYTGGRHPVHPGIFRIVKTLLT